MATYKVTVSGYTFVSDVESEEEATEKIEAWWGDSVEVEDIERWSDY